MKILFSSSESKNQGGYNQKIKKNNFIFPNLFEKRLKVINLYQNFIDSASNKELEKLFGTKKQDTIKYYKSNIFKRETMKVIERYNGVAFNYLNYSSLAEKEKSYIDKNVIIFSNLMGPLLAGDFGLPDYKLKQNEKINNFELEEFYCMHFSDELDEYLKNDDIVDLRAGFYEKFYKIKKRYVAIKFMKNDKVVSHWAKAYRGIVLGLLSKNNIQTIDELIAMEIDNLYIKEIVQQGIKTEIIYNIK